MLNAANGASTLLWSEEGIRDPIWLGGDGDLESTILVLKSGSEGTTEFVVGDVRRFEER